MVSRTKKPNSSRRKDSRDELLRLIPGYDPFKTAGDCYFDWEAADRYIGFIEKCCRHVKGKWAGKPLLLELWQKSFTANLFGWRRPDGTRRYREGFVYVPRKNSKTTTAAALILACGFLDGEAGAELYSSAADREQARLCFEIAKGMVEQEGELSGRAEIFKYSIIIKSRGMVASYKALSSDAGTKHGMSPHCVVNDELHAHPSAELTETLMTGMGARTQPLMIHLTTADFDRPESICNKKHDYACKVRDGVINDPAFLPVIYETLPEADWTDPKVWRAANPNLGVSVTEEYLAHECQRAKDDPTFENTFKRLYLNMKTAQDVRLVPLHYWDACCPVLTRAQYIAREKELDGKPCYLGVDLSSTRDLTAVVAIFPADGFKTLAYGWLPATSAAERDKKDRTNYSAWIRDGWLFQCPGKTISQGQIEDFIKELRKRYDVRQMAFDPWQSESMMDRFDKDGAEGQVIKVQQSYQQMSQPTKELCAAVTRGEIDHGGHPALRWCVNNLAGQEDGCGNVRPSKKMSREKIDLATALILAYSRAQWHNNETESVYAQENFYL